MEGLLIYLLRSGLCLAVFYLFFKWLLSRETLHRFNRAVLLGGMLLSFVLPLCIITVTRDLPAEPESEEVLPMESMEPMELMEPVEPLPAVTDGLPAAGPEPADEPFPWRRWIVACYLLGAAVMLGWVVAALVRVARIVCSGRRQAIGEGMTLVLLPEAVTPFSWWRYVVLSEEDWATCGREILIHEQAHLRLHHSWDLLLTDLLGALQWFNPAMWLLRVELRAIHEYEADEAVLNSGADVRNYQLLLIKKAVGGRWCSVANSFNHSKLKNRITMMLRNRSSRWAGAKALAALPLAAVALGAFAETVYRVPEDKGTQESEEIQIYEVPAAALAEMPAEGAAPMAVPVEVREPALLAAAALPAGEVAALETMPLDLEVPEAAEEPHAAPAASEAAAGVEAPEAALPRTAGAYDPAGLRARAKELRKQAAWERRVAKRTRRWGHDSSASGLEQLAEKDEAQAAALEALAQEEESQAREQALEQAARAREQAARMREQALEQAARAREHAAKVREQAAKSREEWRRSIPFTVVAVSGGPVFGRWSENQKRYQWHGKLRLYQLDRLPAGTVIFLNGKPSTAGEIEGKRLKSVMYDLANGSLVCKR